jgi:hypothetical protein
MFQMGIQGSFGMGSGLMGMAGGMQLGAFAGMGGAGAFAGLGGVGAFAGMGSFGSDACNFSGDAFSGGASGFNHPLLSGGLGMPGCGMNNGMGMIPGMCNPGMMGGQNQQNQQMMQQMMQMLMMIMQMMQQQQMGMNNGMMGGMPGMGGMSGIGGMGGGFGNPMGMGMPGMGGMSGMGGGGFPGMGGGFPGGVGMIPGGNHGGGYQPNYVNGGGNAGGAVPIQTGGVDAAPGSGQAAVNLARQFDGQDSRSIKGKMPNFTAAGGQTNNCADFVSSALEATGRVKGHHVNVKEFEQALRKQGYVQVPANQAKPGDVWMNHSRGHTELVSKAGGTATIGSNNDRQGHQTISERPKSTSSGVYYHLPEK